MAPDSGEPRRRGGNAAAVALAVIVALGHVVEVTVAEGGKGATCTYNEDCDSGYICHLTQHTCEALCPSSCGLNTECKVVSRRAVCKCIDGFTGNPLVACHLEEVTQDDTRCRIDSDCYSNEACIRNKCRDPCTGTCGENTDCRIRNHIPVCSCRRGFVGDPFVKCFPQDATPDNSRCRVDSECFASEACLGGRCRNPCRGVCGANAECRVRNHKPVCSCRRGYVGDPLVKCLDDTPPAPASSPLPPPPSSTSPPPPPPPPPPSSSSPEWLPALHRSCMRCLCAASTSCRLDFGCQEGYCGPFGVSRIYWHEAGRHVLPNDDPERLEAFEDCAKQYSCASRIVTDYMIKLAKDCNGDGRMNCDDFAMSHHNGGYSCHLPLNRSSEGLKYEQRYLKCRGEDEDDDPLGMAVSSS